MHRRRSSAPHLQGIITRRTTIILDPTGAVKEEQTEERFVPVVRAVVRALPQFLTSPLSTAREVQQVAEQRDLERQFFQTERKEERIWTRLTKACNDLKQDLLGQWTEAATGITTRRGEFEDALHYYDTVLTQGPWKRNANYCKLRQDAAPTSPTHARYASLGDLPFTGGQEPKRQAMSSPTPSLALCTSRPSSRSPVNDFIFKHRSRYFRSPVSRLNMAKKLALELEMDKIRASPDVLLKAQKMEEATRKRRIQFLRAKTFQKVKPRPETPGERKDLRAEIVQYRRSPKQEMEGGARVKTIVLQSQLSG